MVNKKKPAASENIKFSGLATGSSYKLLSLQNPKALNSFYRSFLFASPNASESTGVASAEIVERSSNRRQPEMEAQLKVEEQLYANDKISVSNIYPNPASEYADLDYNITANIRDAKLIIYNVLGSQMAELPLNRNDRKLRVNTKDMPTGLYFYQLSLDGQKVATKKMLVRHQQ
ncbi:T9SS type A sorting domain-containing protein [Dyadobacter chenhuakuii]|uniref:T9SS type A sorting domain-containing protein n=1 Tax=Dyadobacter chenhuakuii TaxID=2909339 RepID=A0ABY4XLQ5_9BACT|nr:T9SS type A sorting domain-containing protein [Dyadobacter chenhuakuii]MCF2494259.1 T9SS type A sorting domain-containing protein [Dyadobacter chenhuakuii]USJ31384.1 T9SS type A sorting domain-containing protein [Dyadobacter chenhuakuii]